MANWLENSVFYEIYPQSFCDSNGDGIGDIPGIIGKLDYIRELGCNALWLNPCYLSPLGMQGMMWRITARWRPAMEAMKIWNISFKRPTREKCM